MTDRDDPINQFFLDSDDVDLYKVLEINSYATAAAIKQAYRRLALVYHPDKHATADESAKADTSRKFQQVSFAYAVLVDEKRRQRYDRTGKTDEGFDLAPGEDGWDAYFEEMYERVTKEKLDQSKKEYQGSAEETLNLKDAYERCGGSLGEIMKWIPHSTHDDEPRFIVIISDLIRDGELNSTPEWESSSKDEKSRIVRKKQSDKEAKEAEELAKTLGIWDDFYGSGESAKGKEKGGEEDEEEDHSALQAIVSRRKTKYLSFLDNLADKYAEPTDGQTGRGNGRRRGKRATDDGERPKKKSKMAEMPDIDDAEFERLQKELFDNKDKATGGGESSAKGRKPAKGRKAR